MTQMLSSIDETKLQLNPNPDVVPKSGQTKPQLKPKSNLFKLFTLINKMFAKIAVTRYVKITIC